MPDASFSAWPQARPRTQPLVGKGGGGGGKVQEPTHVQLERQKSLRDSPAVKPPAPAQNAKSPLSSPRVVATTATAATATTKAKSPRVGAGARGGGAATNQKVVRNGLGNGVALSRKTSTTGAPPTKPGNSAARSPGNSNTPKAKKTPSLRVVATTATAATATTKAKSPRVGAGARGGGAATNQKVVRNGLGNGVALSRKTSTKGAGAGAGAGVARTTTTPPTKPGNSAARSPGNSSTPKAITTPSRRVVATTATAATATTKAKSPRVGAGARGGGAATNQKVVRNGLGNGVALSRKTSTKGAGAGAGAGVARTTTTPPTKPGNSAARSPGTSKDEEFEASFAQESHVAVDAIAAQIESPQPSPPPALPQHLPSPPPSMDNSPQWQQASSQFVYVPEALHRRLSMPREERISMEKEDVVDREAELEAAQIVQEQQRIEIEITKLTSELDELDKAAQKVQAIRRRYVSDRKVRHDEIKRIREQNTKLVQEVHTSSPAPTLSPVPSPISFEEQQRIEIEITKLTSELDELDKAAQKVQAIRRRYVSDRKVRHDEIKRIREQNTKLVQEVHTSSPAPTLSPVPSPIAFEHWSPERYERRNEKKRKKEWWHVFTECMCVGANSQSEESRAEKDVKHVDREYHTLDDSAVQDAAARKIQGAWRISKLEHDAQEVSDDVVKKEQELDDAARKVQTIRRRSVAERKAKQETTAARGEAEMNAFEFMEKSDDAQNSSNLARRRWWRLLAVGILSRVPGLGRVGHSDEKKKEGGAANEDENPNASSSVIVILDEPRSPIPKSLERRLSLDRMLEMNSEANQGSAVVEVMPSLRKQTSLRKKDSEVKQTWWGALAKSLLRIPSRSFVNDDEDDEMNEQKRGRLQKWVDLRDQLLRKEEEEGGLVLALESPKRPPPPELHRRLSISPMSSMDEPRPIARFYSSPESVMPSAKKAVQSRNAKAVMQGFSGLDFDIGGEDELPAEALNAALRAMEDMEEEEEEDSEMVETPLAAAGPSSLDRTLTLEEGVLKKARPMEDENDNEMPAVPSPPYSYFYRSLGDDAQQDDLLVKKKLKNRKQSSSSSSSKFSRKVVIAAAALITGVGFSRAFEKKKNVAYKITAGDTLFRLCKLESGGGALEQVLKLNPKLRKRDGQSLRVGETLLLPARLMRKPPAGKR
ncbi:hypothetical protein RI054_23g101130 [Pseudoscourfieldia marina]